MITAVMPTKGRPALFRKKGEPFIRSLGLDYLVNIEEQESEAYGPVENAVYSGNGVGLVGALNNLKESAKGDIIFKIDDDVSGFTWDMKEPMRCFEASFDKYPKLGAICFPYQQEFYYDEPVLYSHQNARLQTCYLIRKELFAGERLFDPFEDFCHFVRLRTKGYYTLLSPTTKIICSPVGKTPGGLNEVDRAERSLLAIMKTRQFYKGINIGVKRKPNTPWKFEPEFSKNELLKKRSLAVNEQAG